MADAATVIEMLTRYQDALREALNIIRNYESDIRNSEWTGVNLVEKGFCQGSIYTDAVPRIERMLEKRE